MTTTHTAIGDAAGRHPQSDDDEHKIESAAEHEIATGAATATVPATESWTDSWISTKSDASRSARKPESMQHYRTKPGI